MRWEKSISPWDCFLAVSALGPAGPGEIREALGEEVDPLEALGPVVGEGLVRVEGGRLRAASSPRAEGLTRLLSLGLAWGIDYNHYCDPALHRLVRAGYRQSFLSDCDLSPDLRRTGRLSLLISDGMALAWSYEPLRLRFVPNLFLEHLAEHFHLAFAPPDGRGPLDPSGTMLAEILALRPSGPRTSRFLRSLLGPSRLDGLGWGHRRLSPPQRRLKLRLVASGRSLLDGRLLENDRRAHRLVRENVASGRWLTVDLLRRYHEVLMEGTGVAGKPRTEPVGVRDNPAFQAAEVGRIPARLERLVERYRRAALPTVGEILRFTASFANELMRIHPFVDGNTRLMKLAICHLLMEKGIPVDEIPPTFEAQVLSRTKGVPGLDDEPLRELLQEVVLHRMNLHELETATRGG